MSWTTHQLKKDGNQIKATYCTAADSALGYLKSTDNTWLTRETWRRIEERKTIKSKILNTKSKRIQERLQKEYSSKDKEIKRSTRQDKRGYVDKLADKAETAAQKGELSTVYRITKQLCIHTKVAASIVKDKDGNALTTEQMQAKRWAEHFTEVLNTEAPTITVVKRIQCCQNIPALLLWHYNKYVFIDKISTIKMEFPPLEACLPMYSFVDIDIIMPACTAVFDTFHPLSCDVLSSLINKLNKTTCVLDPFPIKKQCLDPEILKNYRPVANLSFISKIIEKAIATQIHDHLINNDIVDNFQSAYKAGHSCETALLRVYNDIVTTIGRGNGAMLVLLDLSAAFDTIDHDNLFLYS